VTISVSLIGSDMSSNAVWSENNHTNTYKARLETRGFKSVKFWIISSYMTDVMEGV
jgi:uncharacterized protein (UPF0371 family)